MILARHEKAETGAVAHDQSGRTRSSILSWGDVAKTLRTWLVRQRGNIGQLPEPLKYNSGTETDLFFFFLTKGIEGALVV